MVVCSQEQITMFFITSYLSVILANETGDITSKISNTLAVISMKVFL